MIEDNPDIVGLLGYFLKDAGYDVTEVTSDYEHLMSPDAWDGVDVAIIDLNLPGFGLDDDHPGFGGIRIAAFLQAWVPLVKRVVLTAHGLDYLPGEVFWVAHSVLEKPVDRSALIEALPTVTLPEVTDQIIPGGSDLT